MDVSMLFIGLIMFNLLEIDYEEMFYYALADCSQHDYPPSCYEWQEVYKPLFYLFIMTNVGGVIEVALYLTIVNKFTLPFLHMRPKTLFAVIDKGSIQVYPINERTQTVIHDNRLYFLFNKRLDNFGNTWYIYQKDYNMPIFYELAEPRKLMILYKDSFDRPQKPNKHHIAIPKLKLQLVRHWNIHITPTQVILTPLERKPIKDEDANSFHNVIRSIKPTFRIGWFRKVSITLSEISTSEADGNMLVERVITMQDLQNMPAYTMFSTRYTDGLTNTRIAPKIDTYYSSYNAYLLYKAFNTINNNEFLAKLVGDFYLSKKMIMLLAVMAVIIGLLFMFGQ